MPGLIALRKAEALVVVLALAACAAGQDAADTAAVGEGLRDAARTSQAGRDYIAAVNYYRTLLQRNPQDLEAGLGLARNLRFAGEPGEALEVLRQVGARKPGEPRIGLEQGKTQLAMGRPAEALETLSKAQNAMPDNWDVQTTLGVAYDRLGLADLARAAYQRALLLSPDNPTALNNYALSRAQTGELDGAMELLSRAAMQPAAGPAVRQNLALMHALKGEMDKAERLVRQDLPGELARENIAYLRALSGDTARAGAAPRLVPAPPIAVSQQAVSPAQLPPPLVALEPPPAAVVVPAPSVPKPVSDSASAANAVTVPVPLAPVVEPPRPASDSAQPAIAATVVAPPAASSEAPPTSNEALAQRIFGGGAPLTPYAAPAPAVVAAVAATGFVVQLGSFVDRPAGEVALQRAQRAYGETLAGTEVGLVEGSAGDRAAWRVIARTGAEREDAVKLCDRLRAKGAECLVRRRLAGE